LLARRGFGFRKFEVEAAGLNVLVLDEQLVLLGVADHVVFP